VQTTLLAVAIAIILALVAALVGPLLVDLGTYRALFEREASHLVGLDVRVKGEIDARLLPAPRLTLHDVEIGAPGTDNVRARELNIEFALAPLLRGEWRADDLYLAAPQFSLALDKAGRIQAPQLAVKFDPDAVRVDRLHFDGGRVTLHDAANGSSVTLDRVAFDGSARSLLGPFSGDGSTTIGADYYAIQLSAGRYSEASGLTLRLSVQPRDRPVSLQADGTLKLAGGKPRFDGSLTLQRPAGLARVPGELNQPWQLHGHVQVKAGSALMKDFEFRYGAQEHAIKLAGVVEFAFGKKPHLKAELSATSIDLDRALGGEGGATPGVALRKLAGLAAKAFRPALPIQIGIGIDQVTLAGGVLQNLRGDIAADAGGWNLNSLDFRAPGFTQATLSGQLTIKGNGVSFHGPAVVDANDPQALAAWLEGRAPAPNDALRPLHLQGNVTLGSDKIAVDDLRAGFAGKTIQGHFAYVFAAAGHPSKFDAALHAPELDLDAALGFGQALLAGSALERPHDMAIDADIGRATIAGIEGHDISARVKVAADRWQIDRLSVADLGGAGFAAKGDLMLAGSSPQGSMTVDFTAPAMAPMMALLERFAPTAARALTASAPAMAPARLHAQLILGGNLPPGEAQVGIDGKLGKVQVAVNGQGQIDAKTWRAGDVRLDGKLNADDGKALATMLGLDAFVAVGPGPGELTFDIKGPARGELRVDGRLKAADLAVSVNGQARVFADASSARLRLSVTRADAAPLRGSGTREPLPVAFAGRIALAGKHLKLSDMTATVGGTTLRGELALTLGAQHRVAGEIDADTLAGPSLIAAAIGMPAPAGAHGVAWAWSENPFGGGVFGNYDGQVALKLRRVELLPQLAAREFQATLKLGKNALALDDIDGVVAGGRLSGSLAFARGGDGLTAHGKLALAGADAVRLLRAAARPPVTGTFDLSLDVAGSGLSPAALIGSLHGGGKIALSNAELAGLDPHAFEVVTHAVDQGLVVDNERISDVVRRALDSGQLSLSQAQGTIAVNAGQLRLRQVTAAAALALSGDLDLGNGTLDAHLVLSGKDEAAGQHPDIYLALKGPLTAPTRSIDVSALTGWLTLRAIDNQAKQVQKLEEARKREQAAREKAAREEAEREEAARKQNEAAKKPSASPTSPAGAPSPQASNPPPVRPQKRPRAARKDLAQPALAPPLQLTPTGRGSRAPAMPAPIEVGPLPAPAGAPPPEASVGPQN
jgi:uncharacterized protein involved in outer membrane biogenesis